MHIDKIREVKTGACMPRDRKESSNENFYARMGVPPLYQRRVGNSLLRPDEGDGQARHKSYVYSAQGDGQSGQVVAANTTAKAKSENKPKEIVFAVEKGVAKAIPVKRGISNDQYVEITEGVTDSMKVVSGSYKAINRDLEDGTKVRIEDQKKPGADKPKTETTQ